VFFDFADFNFDFAVMRADDALTAFSALELVVDA
jgi:hypothetical protein